MLLPQPQSSASALESILVHTPSRTSTFSLQKPQIKTQQEIPILSLETLVTINEKRQVSINKTCLNRLKKYDDNEIVFCGIFRTDTKQSALVEQILNKNQSNPQQLLNKTNCLTITTQSLQLHHKQLFFVNYLTSPSVQPCKMFDMFIILCNSVIVQGNLSVFLERIQDCAGRLAVFGEGWKIWPDTVYLLGTERGKKGKLGEWFRRPVQISHSQDTPIIIEQLTSDISSHSRIKSFERLEITVDVMVQLLGKLCEHFNQKKQVLDQKNTHRIFASLIVWRYQRLYAELTYSYDKIGHDNFSNQEPQLFDYILDCFIAAKHQVLCLATLDLNKNLQIELIEHLQEYIDQKERLVIEVNKKKTRKKLDQQMAAINLSKSEVMKWDRSKKIVSKLYDFVGQYDHQSTQAISMCCQKLMKILQRGEQRVKIKCNNQIEQIQCLQKGKQAKQLELKKLKSTKRKIEQNNILLLEQENKLKQNMKGLNQKREVLEQQITIIKAKKEDSVLRSKNQIASKVQHLLQTIRQLQEQQRQNESVLKGVTSQIEFNPELDRIQRKILSLVSENERLSERKSHFTQPKSRFSESNRLPTDHPNNYTFFQQK